MHDLICRNGPRRSRVCHDLANCCVMAGQKQSPRLGGRVGCPFRDEARSCQPHSFVKPTITLKKLPIRVLIAGQITPWSRWSYPIVPAFRMQRAGLMSMATRRSIGDEPSFRSKTGSFRTIVCDQQPDRLFSTQGPLMGGFKVGPCFYSKPFKEILLMSRAYSPRKPPWFWPNGSSSNIDIMPRFRSSASRSTACRRPSPSETTNSQL